MKQYSTSLILENIRSAENVGAIFRTADAVGISKIYLVGYTPDPIDRFGRKQSKVAKTALGAEEIISWEHHSSSTELIKDLKKAGNDVVAVEQDKNANDYKKFKLSTNTTFIVGNEVEGVEKKTLDLCDSIIEIPMKGEKESLNVSVSVGVFLFRVLDI